MVEGAVGPRRKNGARAAVPLPQPEDRSPRQFSSGYIGVDGRHPAGGCASSVRDFSQNGFWRTENSSLLAVGTYKSGHLFPYPVFATSPHQTISRAFGPDPKKPVTASFVAKL